MLTTPACPLRGSIEKQAREAVLSIPGVKAVNIKMDASVPNDGRMRGLLNLPIRNAVAVASGKGGVGKSTRLGQSGRCPGADRRTRRPDGCRHLRSQYSHHDGHP